MRTSLAAVGREPSVFYFGRKEQPDSGNGEASLAVQPSCTNGGSSYLCHAASYSFFICAARPYVPPLRPEIRYRGARRSEKSAASWRAFWDLLATCMSRSLRAASSPVTVALVQVFVVAAAVLVVYAYCFRRGCQRLKSFVSKECHSIFEKDIVLDSLGRCSRTVVVK